MSDIQDWYYRNRQGESTGPISSEELQRLVDELVILKKTYVWTEGLEEWVPASKVGGLFDKQIDTSPKSTTQTPAPTQEASPTRIENPAASPPQPPLMVASAPMIASTPTTAPHQPDQISQPSAAAPIPQLKRPDSNTQAPLQAQSTQVDNPLLMPAMAQQPVASDTAAATPPPVPAPPAAAHATQQVDQDAMDPQQAAMMQQHAMMQQQVIMHQQAMLQHQEAMQVMQAQANMLAQQGTVPTQPMMSASAPLLNPVNSEQSSTPSASSSQAPAAPILATPAQQAVATPQNAATAPMVVQSVAQPQSSTTPETPPTQPPVLAASAPLLTPNAASQPLASPPAAQAAEPALTPVTMAQVAKSKPGAPAPRSIKPSGDKPTKRIKLSKETAPVRLPETILASSSSGATQIAAEVPQASPQAAPVLNVPASNQNPTSSFQDDDNITDLTEQSAALQPATPGDIANAPALAVEPSKVGTKLLVDPNAVTASNKLLVADASTAKPKLNVEAKSASPKFSF